MKTTTDTTPSTLPHQLPKHIRLGVLARTQQEFLRHVLSSRISNDNVAWDYPLHIQLPVVAELPSGTYEEQVILVTDPTSRWAVYAEPRAALRVLALAEHENKAPLMSIMNNMYTGIRLGTMRLLYDFELEQFKARSFDK